MSLMQSCLWPFLELWYKLKIFPSKFYANLIDVTLLWKTFLKSVKMIFGFYFSWQHWRISSNASCLFWAGLWHSHTIQYTLNNSFTTTCCDSQISGQMYPSRSKGVKMFKMWFEIDSAAISCWSNNCIEPIVLIWLSLLLVFLLNLRIKPNKTLI